MFRTRYVITLVVLVFSLFLALPNAGSTKNAKDDVRERSKIKKEWLKNAKDIVQKINDKEATEEFQFLDKNLILAAPNEKGMQFLEGAKSRTWLAIVPLLEKDKKVGGRWQGIVSASTAAHFLSGSRAIVVKEYISYSSAGKAIIFLHEGFHSYDFIKNPYEQQNDKEFCYEEVKAHIFQNKVMSLLGGGKYREVLEKEVRRISAKAKISGNNFSVPGRAEYDENLAAALGKPASRLERDFIQTSVWIHAVFVFLDNNFGKDAEDRKALFLRTIYKNKDLL